VALVPGSRAAAPVWVLGGLVAAAGLAGVACSVRVYVVTRRSAWRASISTPFFLLTSAVGGLATVWWATLASAVVSGSTATDDAFAALGRPLPFVLAAFVLAKLLVESVAVRCVLRGERGRPGAALRLPADVRPVVIGRLACGIAGGIVLPLLGAAVISASAASWLALALGTGAAVLLVLGELLERTAFFAMSAPPR
jgi:formate dehydrogenase iron-sulfur subunit